MTRLLLLALLLLKACSTHGVHQNCPDVGRPPCSNQTGAPPITTVVPVTKSLVCLEGQELFFEQNNVTRYACFNPPRQQGEDEDNKIKWPLIVYLHGSLVTPESLYTFGESLFELRDTYNLSDDPDVEGFAVLSPEGRIAQPFPDDSEPQTGCGFHWDEWYRNADTNVDAAAIDHFLDEIVARGRVDKRRIYVFGWSNGAYMSALYGLWRGDRIAAIGQYAGADPFSRKPCPINFSSEYMVPVVLLRNLCDALVPCSTTNDWINTLNQMSWPFRFYSLGFSGHSVSEDQQCPATHECPRYEGLFQHLRWPSKEVLENTLLPFFKAHPLPDKSVEGR